MSDDGHQQPQTQDDEPKVEDVNAPINIKVRILLFFCSARFLSLNISSFVVSFLSRL